MAKHLLPPIVAYNTLDGMDRCGIGLYTGSGSFAGSIGGLQILNTVLVNGRPYSIDSTLPGGVVINYKLATRCTAAPCPVYGDRLAYVAGKGVQWPYRYGYMTEYPAWFLNRGECLAEARALGLELLREFLIAERPMVPGAPEQADYRGFLSAAPSGGGIA